MSGTPLHTACRNGETVEIISLLEAGADINARDEFGRTPFHEACRWGQNEVVVTLMEKGADIDLDDNGLNPLYT